MNFFFEKTANSCSSSETYGSSFQSNENFIASIGVLFGVLRICARAFLTKTGSIDYCNSSEERYQITNPELKNSLGRRQVIF